MKEKNIKKEIGERIDYIRKQKKMTNPEFARYINTTLTQLLSVIKGDRGFSTKKLLEIAKITGYPIEFILEGKMSSMDDDIKDKIALAEKHIKEAYEIIESITGITIMSK